MAPYIVADLYDGVDDADTLECAAVLGTWPMAVNEAALRRSSEVQLDESSYSSDDDEPSSAGLALRTINPFDDDSDDDLSSCRMEDIRAIRPVTHLDSERSQDMESHSVVGHGALSANHPEQAVHDGSKRDAMTFGVPAYGHPWLSMVDVHRLYMAGVAVPISSSALLQPQSGCFYVPAMVPVHSSLPAVPTEHLGPAVQSQVGSKPKRHARKCGVSGTLETPLPSPEVLQTYNSLMFRRMPRNFDSTSVKTLLDLRGFLGRYRFLYAPIDFKRHSGYGYCLVVFDSHESALKAWEDLAGFADWDRQSELQVSIAELQGLDEHIDRYRDSPVMHDAVPDSYKPKLFVADGTLRDFPAPRKSVRAPAGWRRSDRSVDGLQ